MLTSNYSDKHDNNFGTYSNGNRFRWEITDLGATDIYYNFWIVLPNAPDAVCNAESLRRHR